MSFRQDPLHLSTSSCYYWLSLFGGHITLQCFVHISDKTSCNTKVVFNHFDLDPYTVIYSILLEMIGNVKVMGDQHPIFREEILGKTKQN